MSIKEDENGKELKQPDYDEDKDQLEESKKRKQDNQKQLIRFCEKYI